MCSLNYQSIYLSIYLDISWSISPLLLPFPRVSILSSARLRLNRTNTPHTHTHRYSSLYRSQAHTMAPLARQKLLYFLDSTHSACGLKPSGSIDCIATGEPFPPLYLTPLYRVLYRTQTTPNQSIGCCCCCCIDYFTSRDT